MDKYRFLLLFFLIIFLFPLTADFSKILAANLDNISSFYTVTTGDQIRIKPSCGDYLNVNQTTVVPGKSGGARYFSGSGDNLTISDKNLSDGNSPFSITLWFKTNKNFPKNQYGVLMHYGLSQNQKGFYLGIGSDNDNVVPDNSLFASPHGDSLSSKISTNDDQWHHAGITFDGSVWNLYLDAKLKNTKPMALNLTKQGTLIIGSTIDGLWPYEGYIDEIHYYQKTLSKREIAFDMGQEKLSDLISVWKMDETDLGTTNETFFYETSDFNNWNPNSNTYSFTPVFTDGATIKNLSFSCTSVLTGQKYTKSTKIVVFRNFSTLKKYLNNPIIDIQTTPWNSMGVDAPYIHDYQQINGIYYAPVQINNSTKTQYSWYDKIAIYKSSDLLHWNPASNGPAVVNSTGQWDDHFLLHPTIIKIGNLWHMYYSALAPNVSIFAPYSESWGPEQIGLATSSDLINWTKHPGNPVYGGEVPGKIHQSASIPSVVQKDVNSFFLFYHDRINDGIKIAASQNGVNWSYLNTALTAKTGDWDHPEQLESSGFQETGLDPFVIKNKKGFFEMVYSINYNNTQKCGTALSEDGQQWYKYQNPILSPSNTPGSLDQYYVGDCVPLEKDDRYYLFYAGIPAVGYKGVNFDVGVGMLSCLEPDGETKCFSPNTNCPLTSQGDINCSGKIDIFDYNIFLGNFGSNSNTADINGDGTVNIFDYNILLGNFGS